MNKLFSEEDKVPQHCLKLESTPEYATYKQSNTVWNCVVF